MQRARPAAARLMASIAAAVVLGASAAPRAAGDAAPPGDYQPSYGQEGKDVIWIPTPLQLVDRMLHMAKTTANDFVVDLGSGDGRMVIAAAKNFGARALGIEYNPDMVALSHRNAENAGVSDRVEFLRADVFDVDFSRATVLTMYLLPRLNLKLRPRILALRAGTRVVSHAFTMGDWQPDRTETVAGRTAYLWIVPASVEGHWSWGNTRPYRLELRQHYQTAEGLITVDGTTAQFRDGKLDGDRISFSVIEYLGLGTVRREFTGRVRGDTIDGTVKLPDGAGVEKWTARRVDSSAARR